MDAYAQLLHCPSCGGEYRDEDQGGVPWPMPRVLQCGHTRCSGCFVDIAANDVLQCPECGETEEGRGESPMERVRALGKNFPLLALRQRALGPEGIVEKRAAAMLKTKTAHKPAEAPKPNMPEYECENCLKASNALGFLWCLNCEATFCEACFKEAHQNRVMSRHRKRILGPEDEPLKMKAAIETYCTMHDSHYALFCFTDLIPICSACKHEQHRTHKTASLDKACTDLRKSLHSVNAKAEKAIKAMQVLISKFGDVHSQTISVAEADVVYLNSTYERLHALIHQHKQRIVAAFALGTQYKFDLVSSRIDKLTALTEKLQVLKSRGTEAKTMQDIELVLRCVALTSDLHKAVNTSSKVASAAHQELQGQITCEQEACVQAKIEVQLAEKAANAFAQSLERIPEVDLPEQDSDDAMVDSFRPVLPTPHIEAIRIVAPGQIMVQWVPVQPEEVEAFAASSHPDFLLQHAEDNPDPEENWKILGNTAETHFVAINLSLKATHFFRVCTRNGFGYSIWSPVQSARFDDIDVDNEEKEAVDVDKQFVLDPDEYITDNDLLRFDFESPPAAHTESGELSITDDTEDTSTDRKSEEDRNPLTVEYFDPFSSMEQLDAGASMQESRDAIPAPSPTQGSLKRLVGKFSDDADGVRAIPRSAVSQYLECFSRADQDKDGFISGMEAREYFSKHMHVSVRALKHAWDLGDRGAKGFLSKQEFVIVLHILEKHMADPEQPLPTVLPPELEDFEL